MKIELVEPNDGTARIITPLTLGVQRTAEMLDSSKTTVWKYIGTGELRSARIGRKRVVFYESIIDFANRNVVFCHED